MKKIIGTLIICVVLVATLSILSVEAQADSNCQLCNTSAACPGGCYGWPFGLGYKCSDTIAHPNAGKKCDSSSDEDDECHNTISVLCGMTGNKNCAKPPAPPDCVGIDHDRAVSTSGCPS